MNVVEVSVKVL